MTAVVTGDESLAARRVTLLEWLARGRDIRLAAELSGETRDWATATAVAAGHPHLDKVRQALTEARRALAEERATPVRQAPARAVVQRPAPVRPIRESLPEHVAAYAAPAPLPTVPRSATEGHYPCAQGVLCRCTAASRATCPGMPVAPVAELVVEPHLHTFVEGRDEHGRFVRCEGCEQVTRSMPCEVCQVTVAAAHIARTGRARHTWHPVTPEPSS